LRANLIEGHFERQGISSSPFLISDWSANIGDKRSSFRAADRRQLPTGFKALRYRLRQ
jgi:hypothetical protein